jgi:hypothetical protein
MTNVRDKTPINWWDAEPSRHTKDQQEVAARFPDLRWVPENPGRWEGRLPMWPLDRTPPAGLSDLLGGEGMQVVILYRQAYPMVPPRIYPVDPRPEPLECTQQRWHVMGDGSLCLFQTETAWDPADSICDLLVKAAAWRGGVRPPQGRRPHRDDGERHRQRLAARRLDHADRVVRRGRRRICTDR